MKSWQLLQNWPEKDKKEMGDVIDLDFMFLQSFIKRGQNVRWKTQQKKNCGKHLSLQNPFVIVML